MEQLDPAARVLPQVVVSEKSPGLVPIRVMLAMSKTAFPVLLRVTAWAVLVVPTFCEVKVIPLDERLTAGAVGGGGVPPPPLLPPQATQTPTTSSIVANSNTAGRLRIAGKPRSMARINNAASVPVSPLGRWKLGGAVGRKEGGAVAGPVVVIVRVAVTGDALVGLTEAGATTQVAPVGQPLVTLRFTVPVNPDIGVTLMVEAPPCPGAEMLRGEGLAERLKSETATAVALEVDPA